MSTKAGTIGVSGLPARFTLWAAAVSVLAAAALIMSALALTLAGRDDRPVTGGRQRHRPGGEHRSPSVVPGEARSDAGPMLAEAVRAEGSAALWYPEKLEAMQGRMLAG